MEYGDYGEHMLIRMKYSGEISYLVCDCIHSL